MLREREADRTTSPISRSAGGLRCAACGHVITEAAQRIAMSGAHVHVFTNPGGFVYEIGCFAAAPGCACVGPDEDAFSWFPGWRWQVATCGSCSVQLGWSYRNAGGRFYGLILAQLRES